MQDGEVHGVHDGIKGYSTVREIVVSNRGF